MDARQKEREPNRQTKRERTRQAERQKDSKPDNQAIIMIDFRLEKIFQIALI